MDRPFVWLPGLALVALLAAVSLAWGAEHALEKSDDLLRRAEEVRLFLAGHDPYQDPDMTYPPTALPVFSALVAPVPPSALKSYWLFLNLVALGVLCTTTVWLWGRAWPAWVQVAFCLTVIATKPVRGGLGLGQFHLIPTALIVVAVAALRARRELLAGVLVGLALTKPTLALPFLGLLAAQRYFRALGAAVGVQGLLLVAASGWLWASPTRLIGQWLHRAQGQETAGLVDVPSLLGRAWPGAPVGSAWVTLGLLALTIALCYVWRRRSELGLVAFCGFAGAIMVYHRPYDLVLLVPAMALLVERARTGAVAWNWHRLAVAGLFCGLLVVPNDPIVREGWETAYDAVFTVLLYAFLLMVTLELGQESSRAGGGPAEARVCLDS